MSSHVRAYSTWILITYLFALKKINLFIYYSHIQLPKLLFPTKGLDNLVSQITTQKSISKTWIEHFYNPIAFSMQNFEIIIGFVIL